MVPGITAPLAAPAPTPKDAVGMEAADGEFARLMARSEGGVETEVEQDAEGQPWEALEALFAEAVDEQSVPATPETVINGPVLRRAEVGQEQVQLASDFAPREPELQRDQGPVEVPEKTAETQLVRPVATPLVTETGDTFAPVSAQQPALRTFATERELVAAPEADAIQPEVTRRAFAMQAASAEFAGQMDTDRNGRLSDGVSERLITPNGVAQPEMPKSQPVSEPGLDLTLPEVAHETETAPIRRMPMLEQAVQPAVPITRAAPLVETQVRNVATIDERQFTRLAEPVAPTAPVSVSTTQPVVSEAVPLAVMNGIDNIPIAAERMVVVEPEQIQISETRIASVERVQPSQVATMPNTAAPVVHHRDIAVQIATAAVNGSVDVTLYPEELGRVRLTVTALDVGYSVKIEAERGEVLESMRRNLDVLSSAFEEAGYQSLNFSFSENASGGNSDTEADDGDERQPTGPVQAATPAASIAMRGSLDLRL